MTRGRWKLSEEQIATEAYCVLIDKQKPSTVFKKEMLILALNEKGVYEDFLKLCLEYDDSPDLRDFRKGLLMVVRSFGPNNVAKDTGISRVSLYRMLSKGGNPRLKNLIRLCKALDIRLWIVDADFITRRSAVIRPKNIKGQLSMSEDALDHQV